MAGSNYYKRTIVKEELHSTALGEVRRLRIFLPPGYDERIQYPVFYCHDGEQFFNFGRIATHATKIILDEDITPFIVVGVEVNEKLRTQQYAPEGEQFIYYCRFFTDEMLPMVERKYAVQTSTSGRIVAGDSLGGTVALHLALDRPDLFQQVLSLSGAFLTSTLQRIAHASDLTWLRMYMLIGSEETDVHTDRGAFDFLSANRQSHQLLKERGTQVHYVEKPGKHIWGFWQQELPDAIRYFLS